LSSHLGRFFSDAGAYVNGLDRHIVKTLVAQRCERAVYEVEINTDLSDVRSSIGRNYANKCLSVLLRLQGCGKRLKPLTGDCSVFCSFGSVQCPPISQAGKN